MDDATAARHRNAAKKRKDEKKRKVLVKELNDGMIHAALTLLSKSSDDNGGRLPYRKMAEVVQGLRDRGVLTTRHAMNKKLLNYNKNKPAVISAENEALATAPLADITGQYNSRFQKKFKLNIVSNFIVP